jgi:hypothetical protein
MHFVMPSGLPGFFLRTPFALNDVRRFTLSLKGSAQGGTSLRSFRTPIFYTPVHTFAQTSRPISIDAAKHNEYLPSQIEPKSLKTLRLSFKSAAA